MLLSKSTPFAEISLRQTGQFFFKISHCFAPWVYYGHLKNIQPRTHGSATFVFSIPALVVSENEFVDGLKNMNCMSFGALFFSVHGKFHRIGFGRIIVDRQAYIYTGSLFPSAGDAGMGVLQERFIAQANGDSVIDGIFASINFLTSESALSR
jgi:hypothetical protein